MSLAVLLVVFAVVIVIVARINRAQHSRERAVERIVLTFRSAELSTPLPDALLPTKDPEEPFTLDAGADAKVIPAHNLLLIEYTDAQGNRSRRRITVRSFSPVGDSDGYLQCYCHERQGNRSFYVRRITALTDMKTGEVVTDVRKYFEDLFPKQPDDPLIDLVQSLEDELMVLTYLARADRRMVRAERDVIISFIRNAREAIDLDGQRLDQRIARLHCDPPEFRIAVRNLTAQPTQARETVLAAAAALIDADGKKNGEEVATLSQLRTAFGL